MTTDNERYFKQCYEDVNKELRAMESAHAREMDALMENRAQRNFYRWVARAATLLWLIGNFAGAVLTYYWPQRIQNQGVYVIISCCWFFIFLRRMIESPADR